jgi:hypothetical protein
VHGQFTFLSGEICPSGVGVTVSAFMANPEVPCMATSRGETEVSRGHSSFAFKRDEGPNEEVRGGLHEFGSNDESVRRS